MGASVIQRTARPGRVHMIAAASIGNALEFYDFIIYGFFAVPIGNAFFPGHEQSTRLLLTFGTFGVSFFAVRSAPWCSAPTPTAKVAWPA